MLSYSALRYPLFLSDALIGLAVVLVVESQVIAAVSGDSQHDDNDYMVQQQLPQLRHQRVFLVRDDDNDGDLAVYRHENDVDQNRTSSAEFGGIMSGFLNSVWVYFNSITDNGGNDDDAYVRSNRKIMVLAGVSMVCAAMFCILFAKTYFCWCHHRGGYDDGAGYDSSHRHHGNICCLSYCCCCREQDEYHMALRRAQNVVLTDPNLPELQHSGASSCCLGDNGEAIISTMPPPDGEYAATYEWPTNSKNNKLVRVKIQLMFQRVTTPGYDLGYWDITGHGESRDGRIQYSIQHGKLSPTGRAYWIQRTVHKQEEGGAASRLGRGRVTRTYESFSAGFFSSPSRSHNLPWFFQGDLWCQENAAVSSSSTILRGVVLRFSKKALQKQRYTHFVLVRAAPILYDDNDSSATAANSHKIERKRMVSLEISDAAVLEEHEPMIAATL